MLLYAPLPNFPPISPRLIFITIYLANKKMPEENRPMDKPHQHLFSWDAHMVKAQNTIIHAVICTAAKFSTNITKINTRKRRVFIKASIMYASLSLPASLHHQAAAAPFSRHVIHRSIKDTSDQSCLIKQTPRAT
jgi:hypothetical protein